MSKTRVKKDSHGIYVYGGGYLWRPVYPLHYNDTDLHLIDEDDSVTVTHRGGTPLASIKRSDGHKEIWYSHGCYYDKTTGKFNRKNPENYFKPNYERW